MDGESRETACSESLRTRKEFPILFLELSGKYKGEVGDIEVTNMTSRRMVAVDLENEEEWGDINSFWDGEGLSLGLGNDEDGYWKIVRAFEIMEPTEELHEDKYPVSYELSLDQLAELMDERVESWCG